ncbi:MAG: exodeoxyribonuclease VII small subunit [Acidimicrobiales bacterium]|nr:exodeoxyribonuclease VII small subunit [Acidimicrobiales bacterium]
MPDPDDSDPAIDVADVAELGYGEALAELETILAELEDDTLDVDLLAERVARAAALIAHCRGRIDGARMEVERIVAGFDDPDPT